MDKKDLIKKLQLAMNAMGENLTVDGDFGPKTQAASEKYDFSLTCKKKEIIQSDGRWFGASWVGYMAALIGLNERTDTLNLILAPHWKNVGLPQFKDLRGGEHAWCSLAMDWAMTKAGFKGTANAMALSWRTWGKSCPYWFGAVLGIRHASGGGHVTTFLYWVDESAKKAACLGGNQGDEMNISVYNLSGNNKGHDEVINGPRWPINAADGQFVPISEIKKQIAALPKNSGSTT
jgi:uncharacterized protein (TIGR02594 family)